MLRRVYHLRNVLAGLPMAAALLSTATEYEAEALLWSIGLAVVTSGVALRTWAQAHIAFRLGPRRHLTVTGPYALTRNPLYIGNTAICAGAVILSEVLWLVPVTVLWCVFVYSIVVRHEESRLLRKYGEAYRLYRARVPRWVPRAGRPVVRSLWRPLFLRAVAVEILSFLLVIPFLIKELMEH